MTGTTTMYCMQSAVERSKMTCDANKPDGHTYHSIAGKEMK